MKSRVTKNSLFIKISGHNRRISLKKRNTSSFFKDLQILQPSYFSEFIKKYGVDFKWFDL